MPTPNNFNAFLGAVIIGAISAAGMYLFEHFRQQKTKHKMAKELARLDQEVSQVKREVQQLMVQKNEKSLKPKRSRNVRKANSILSTTTTVTEDYNSAVSIDSSDLEFYDVSDEELDAPNANSTNGFAINNLDNILKEIDTELDSYSVTQLEKSLQRLEDLSFDYPENTDILWRLGKAHHKISENSDDKEFVQDHISKGIEILSKALNLKEDDPDVHKWYAILVGSRSEFVSLQERIDDGHKFKKHVDAAIALSPNDPSLHYMLGRFDFEVAGLKWYERKVAAALFSEPPNATYADALLHFMQAEQLANFEFKENKLMIAKCKIATSDYKEAMEWLTQASNCKQGDGLDDKIDSEVKALLGKYNSYR
ncbi:unnamed protein product [Acanthoscelides obtectus]|uniref:Regulator of microtubule dynamics protein 1 n=1 Tax=Acanthoscelides obtectus TaxID=200917 RepID=A0A9P0LUN5_ACAOB|nr:unnamed protein product [Acanthoscelides obtectus]CAK1664044.1 Regulator of microtubule dynamics protein 3 [Acanthoscelides obtectus]